MNYFIIIGLLLIVYYFIVTNGMISKRNKVDESYSGIDVALSKRYDLITNLVQVVKGYSKHEQETLTILTQLRQANHQDLSALNKDLDQAQSSIILLAESYPQLKADTQYTNLQKALVDVEENLQAARRLHNRNVNDYNTYIQLSPQNMIPKIKKAQAGVYFELETDKKGSPQL